MPIKVIKNLPAITKLAQENIFVMDTERAENQQIRPLNVANISAQLYPHMSHHCNTR